MSTSSVPQTPSRGHSRESTNLNTPARHSTRLNTPARHSTRITTPVRNPNFVQTSGDLRKSVPQAPTSAHRQGVSESQGTRSSRPRRKSQPSAASQPQKRKRRLEVDDSQADSDQPQTIMDMTQDSDEENSRVVKRRKARGRKDVDADVDTVEDYFHPLVFADGEDSSGTPLHYECRWCGVSYKKAKGSQGNLVLHRDGNKTQNPCPKRGEAILAGAKLPTTQMEKNQGECHQGSSPKVMMTQKFDQKTLNQILVLWLIRHSLPWCQMEDELLEIAFNYVKQGIKLFSRVWAAIEAHKIYLNLQATVILRLQNIKSKITLIHDVWTTKGNRHAFMGMAAAYVTDNWEFVITHLGLKFIAWTHKAQTTDSGSNNGTMVAEVDRMIEIKTGVKLKLSEKHIRCFCHKIGLILTAGLKAISIDTDGLTKTKASTLGFVPGLEPVLEEPKDPVHPNTFKEHVVFGPNPKDNNVDDEDNEVSHDSENRQTPSAQLSFNKVDFVIQKITSSAARRSEFDTWAKKFDYDGPSLIAGYGIRWNIKFISRDRAYQARQVINKLIDNERDRHEKEGSGNCYDDTEITQADWDNVKRLNDVLSEFYFITKKMEGDIPLAGMILAEYRYIKALLNKKMTLTTKADFHPMYTKMLDRTDKYLSEALKCDAILLATILNPSYRLSIFNLFFPSHLTRARNLIQEKFIIQKIEYEASTPPQVNTQAGKQSTHDPVREFDDIEFFPDPVETSPEDELTVYLGGKYKWPHPQASKCLLWWKSSPSCPFWQGTIWLAAPPQPQWSDVFWQLRTYVDRTKAAWVFEPLSGVSALINGLSKELNPMASLNLCKR
ncbi:hypothetical protein PGTUg99_028778 [Puccinia graminis f. sp. tritici]|uniref:hAT-like transposase RNase-H fold domain-containing protein n=1 Tax=Puccinia graminis f. sp. tritici TaxID=56615 RepID=A0A5B0SK32_PUCGR|nr:hypothetical protein PGTUg99_028778 [Puccinia graminis f. sp. tritici]